MKKSHSSEENEKTSKFLQESTIPPLANAKAPVDDLTLPKVSSTEKISGVAVNTKEGSQKTDEASESQKEKATFDDLPFSITPWSLEMSDYSKNKNMEITNIHMTSFSIHLKILNHTI